MLFETEKGLKKSRIRDIKISDLIMSVVGSVVGIGLLFTGIFTDYVYTVTGGTILTLALFHLSWARKS